MPDSFDIDSILDEIGQDLEMSTDVKVIKDHLKTMSNRITEALFMSFFPKDEKPTIVKQQNKVAKKIAEWVASDEVEEGELEEEEEEEE